SEVPVGTSLSGGLDSSAVAAVIARHLREQPEDERFSAVGSRQNTFSAVFPNSSNDEERYVDALLDDYQGQITAHKITPRPASSSWVRTKSCTSSRKEAGRGVILRPAST